MIALLLKFGLGGLNILKTIRAALTRFFNALNVQGWVGLAASLVLSFAWLRAAGEARHWRKESGQFERLYNGERTALDQTVADYRAAARQARQADAANAAWVQAEQAQINERTSDDYEARISDARAAAQRLRAIAQAAAYPGSGGAAPVPGLPAALGGPAQAAGEDRLPAPPREVATSRGPLDVDDALTATEQAIQLDELIKWVREQAAVDSNRKK